MGTRQVKLQGVGSCLLRALGKFNPIVLEHHIVNVLAGDAQTLLKLHMIEAMTIFVGKSRFSSRTHSSQYSAVFSEISSMLRKAPWPGPYSGPLVVPRTILGDTFVTRSYNAGVNGYRH